MPPSRARVKRSALWAVLLLALLLVVLGPGPALAVDDSYDDAAAADDTHEEDEEHHLEEEEPVAKSVEESMPSSNKGEEDDYGIPVRSTASIAEDEGESEDGEDASTKADLTGVNEEEDEGDGESDYFHVDSDVDPAQISDFEEEVDSLIRETRELSVEVPLVVYNARRTLEERILGQVLDRFEYKTGCLHRPFNASVPALKSAPSSWLKRFSADWMNCFETNLEHHDCDSHGAAEVMDVWDLEKGTIAQDAHLDDSWQSKCKDILLRPSPRNNLAHVTEAFGLIVATANGLASFLHSSSARDISIQGHVTARIALALVWKAVWERFKDYATLIHIVVRLKFALGSVLRYIEICTDTSCLKSIMESASSFASKVNVFSSPIRLIEGNGEWERLQFAPDCTALFSLPCSMDGSAKLHESEVTIESVSAALTGRTSSNTETETTVLPSRQSVDIDDMEDEEQSAGVTKRREEAVLSQCIPVLNEEKVPIAVPSISLSDLLKAL